MRGKVLGFDNATGTGMISGDDGSRYPVVLSDIQGGARSLIPGGIVDFEVINTRATAVYPVASLGSMEQNKWVAALLAFFLGAFGVHKFYLGRKKEGIIMLLCFFPGMFLVLPVIVSSLVAFIEAIIYVIKSDQEFHEQYVVGGRAWF